MQLSEPCLLMEPTRRRPLAMRAGYGTYGILIDVEILSATKQEIHALIRVKSSSLTCLISAIYASPRFAKRCILWNNLITIASRHNLPWLALGDFNDVLSEDEKFGGNGICGKRVRAYQECMNECKLLDLGFSGQNILGPTRGMCPT